MTDAPQGGAPPKEEAAAQVGRPEQRRDFQNNDVLKHTTSDTLAEARSLLVAERHRYENMAFALAPRGELRRYLPHWPLWCRRIGADIIHSLIYHQLPDRSEIQLLQDAHVRATAKREQERQDREEDRDWLRHMPQRRSVRPATGRTSARPAFPRRTAENRQR